jgi:hypothetical protein
MDMFSDPRAKVCTSCTLYTDRGLPRSSSGRRSRDPRAYRPGIHNEARGGEPTGQSIPLAAAHGAVERVGIWQAFTLEGWDRRIRRPPPLDHTLLESLCKHPLLSLHCEWLRMLRRRARRRTDSKPPTDKSVIWWKWQTLLCCFMLVENAKTSVVDPQVISA